MDYLTAFAQFMEGRAGSRWSLLITWLVDGIDWI